MFTRAPLPAGWQLVGFLAGLASFGFFLLADTPLGHSTAGARPAHAAAVVSLMALWWLTEAVPIYWTACVPLAAFPLLRVFEGGFTGSLERTAVAYVDPYIFLFAGGMAIAAAMQQWNLHRRIALTIMYAIGTDPKRLLAGFLVATAAISLWISNTATAAMLMPIGMAVIAQIEHQLGGRRLASYGMAIMLSIAYGANVGGIGTKIGTAPNAQFAGFLETMGRSITFLEFLLVGLPFVVMFLPVVWWGLWRLGRRDRLSGDLGKEAVAEELAALGPVRFPEKVVLTVFAATALLWIAGKQLTTWLKPQVSAVNLTSAHVEGGIAVAAAVLLFCWPLFSEPWKGRRVLELPALARVPWETLLLLGGGFAMAAGVQGSGLSTFMTAGLSGLKSLPPFAQVLLAATAAVGLSAVASNTATIAVLLVVLKEAVSPEILTTVLFAATVGASCDFALPAGTPPNAIVFGSGYVTIPRMARLGVVLDLTAALMAAAWCYFIVRLVLP